MKILHNGILYETYETPSFSNDDLTSIAKEFGFDDISKVNLLLEAINKDDELENPDNLDDMEEGVPEEDEIPEESNKDNLPEEPVKEEPPKKVEPTKKQNTLVKKNTSVKEEPKKNPVVNYRNWLRNKSLRTLYNNYFKLWPDRKGSHNHFEIRAVPNNCLYLEAKTLQCKVDALVQSEIDNPSEWYDTSIQIRRKNLTDIWSVDGPCEVRCTCKAFKYFVAYPNIQNKSFYGRPSGENKIPNNPMGKNNPRKVPALCKHLAAITQKLIEEGKLAS